MESEIHQLELEAYSSVLRAFKAQSDAISWEKESLITELRKELRVSDQEHRELLSKANADDIIMRIRECVQANGLSGLHRGTQVIYDSEPSHVVSASFKRRKTSHSISAGTMSARPKTVSRNSIPPEDIRWEGERGLLRNQSKKDCIPSQNGIDQKNGCDSIEILYTESVIKEVERLFAKSHLNLYEIQQAKTLLKDHEQSLMEALARLAEKYDEDYKDMVGDGQECSDDVQLIENGAISYDQQ